MVVGLCGAKRSGKDTIGNILAKEYGFIHYAFANPIREALKVIYLWTDDFFEGNKKDEVDPVWGISPRQAMQDLGTEWAQLGLCDRYPEYNEVTGRKIWVKRFQQWYLQTYSMRVVNPNIVITDVRFPHEQEALRACFDFYLGRASRPSVENGADLHESEQHYNSLEANYTICNHGSLIEFEDNARDFAKWLIDKDKK